MTRSTPTRTRAAHRPCGADAGGSPAVTLWRHFAAGRWEEARALLHPSFTARWPQSGECFRGAENYIAVNRAHPAPGWTLEVVCSAETPAVCALQLTLHHPEGVDHGSCFYTVADGLLLEATEIWAETAPAPAWRAAWAECLVA